LLLLKERSGSCVGGRDGLDEEESDENEREERDECGKEELN